MPPAPIVLWSVNECARVKSLAIVTRYFAVCGTADQRRTSGLVGCETIGQCVGACTARPSVQPLRSCRGTDHGETEPSAPTARTRQQYVPFGIVFQGRPAVAVEELVLALAKNGRVEARVGGELELVTRGAGDGAPRERRKDLRVRACDGARGLGVTSGARA